MEFKDRIKSLRDNGKLSPSQLGAAMDKSEGAVRSWESGKAKPDADTIIRLAEYFDCTTDYLLGLSDFQNYGERKYLENITNNIDSQKSKLNFRALSAFLGIEKNILDAFFCLVDEDDELAEKLLDHMYAISQMLCFTCEDAFAVFNVGYDSFDDDEIPLIADEIKKSASSDVATLCEYIAVLMDSIVEKMIDALPKHDAPKTHYMILIKQSLEDGERAANNPDDGNPDE